MINSSYTKIEKIGFWALLGIGVFLRIYKLGIIPIGLNADEASIGYEAYSLLKTGADRWGIQLPPYFLSFGSGQNTLYAYLSVPFLYFFDLSQTSIRLLSAALGIGTLPLVYWLAKTLLDNTRMALACVLIYTFDPFLFISARWALEINILPFFAIFSIYIFTRAFEIIRKGDVLNFNRKLIIIATFPSLAFIIYSYASALFVVFPFIFLIGFYFWKEIWSKKGLFMLSMSLFLVWLAPFILFILKNNILKSELFIEQFLPFQIPEMLSNREQMFKGFGQNLAIIKKNIVFIFSGFKEFDRTFNTTKFYSTHFFMPIGWLGFFYLCQIVINKTQKQFAVLFFWGICCFLPFLFFEMNLNRSIHLQSVIPLFVAIGLYFLFQFISDSRFKKYFALGFIGLFTIQTTLFIGEYFNRYPSYDSFLKNFEPAILTANQQKKLDEPIAITSSLVFNYLYVGFYSKYPPKQFQSSLSANFKHQNVAVHSFGPYLMLGDISNTDYYLNADSFEKLKAKASFLAVLNSDEQMAHYEIDQKSLIDTNLYTQNILHKSDSWKVIRFTKK